MTETDNVLVLATGNPGKLREIQALLADTNWQIRAQSDYDFEEAEETGLTFVENAILKARHACRHTGLAAIADDSGLEVDALGGQPGIYSARYSGIGATDSENTAKLLNALQDITEDQRTARFRCVMVYLRNQDDPAPLICQGTWEGKIGFTPQGENGFGYDPVFYLPELDCTSAELPATTKNQLSHRGKALTALANALQN